jgi:hypothetical protein
MNESIWTINAHEVPSVYDVVTWNDNSIIEAFERDLHEYERQHYQRQVTPHLPKMNLSAPAALSASTSVVKPTTVSSASTSLQNQSTDSVVKSVSSSERVESSAQEHLTSPGKVNSDRNSARPDDSTSNAFEQWKQQWYTWYDQSCMDPAHRDAYFAQVVDQSAHQPITPSTPVQTSTSESCPAKVESNDTTKPTPAQPEEHLKVRLIFNVFVFSKLI